MKKNFGIFWVLVLIISGCSSVKNLAVHKDIERTFNQSSLFSNQFTGFSLYDIEKGKFISGYNDTKRFTPASNLKILTMYATLKSFTDSIPGLLYQSENDSLWVQPVGDPTFLDSRFKSQPVFDFLNQNKPIYIIWPENDLLPFGSGWAWDDYKYDYQPQRNWWPVYGNKVSITKVRDSLKVSPAFFEEFVDIAPDEKYGGHVDRDLKYNLFKIASADTARVETTIPFEMSQELLSILLRDTLKSQVLFSNRFPLKMDTLYSHPIDLVLSLMMKASDNLIAEQLLIQAAWKNGYSSIEPFIKHVRLIWLSELNDFVWVDGSGLSRYNLIAPVDQVRLLKKSYEEFGLERIKNIMAVGGESGTIKKWYGGEEPYIYAKTGTLSNNHNLSGFMKTRSGKWMIFSFMNNHYTVTTDEVKTAMQSLLENIRDTY
ncbi:MAG: D-alanyl-D-alanine carboxypeptidase [Cyclobacteriaceae bacterium]